MSTISSSKNKQKRSKRLKNNDLNSSVVKDDHTILQMIAGWERLSSTLHKRLDLLSSELHERQLILDFEIKNNNKPASKKANQSLLTQTTDDKNLIEQLEGLLSQLFQDLNKVEANINILAARHSEDEKKQFSSKVSNMKISADEAANYFERILDLYFNNVIDDEKRNGLYNKDNAISDITELGADNNASSVAIWIDDTNITSDAHNSNSLNNNELFQRQNDIMHSQDSTLNELSSIISRQRELGVRMGEELDEHSRLLDDMNNTLDITTTRRVGQANEQLESVNRERKRQQRQRCLIGGSCTAIVILIVVLIIVVKIIL